MVYRQCFPRFIIHSFARTRCPPLAGLCMCILSLTVTLRVLGKETYQPPGGAYPPQYPPQPGYTGYNPPPPGYAYDPTQPAYNQQGKTSSETTYVLFYVILFLLLSLTAGAQQQVSLYIVIPFSNNERSLYHVTIMPPAKHYSGCGAAKAYCDYNSGHTSW